MKTKDNVLTVEKLIDGLDEKYFSKENIEMNEVSSPKLAIREKLDSSPLKEISRQVNKNPKVIKR